MPAQPAINSIEFARKALEIHDRIAVSQFSRLSDLLSGGGGELDYRLAGGSNAEGKPVLRLHAQGDVMLQCQRCLEAFKFELDIDSTFIIVTDEAKIPAASEDDEELSEDDYLVADAQMQVLDLIEDELLLALPYAPKHVEAECGASGTLKELKKPSPFAILQGLKTGKNQHNS
jgi:uncharacterized protein